MGTAAYLAATGDVESVAFIKAESRNGISVGREKFTDSA